jgi:hypothetical protein
MESPQSDNSANDDNLDVSIVLPCLDESETLAKCIWDIQRALRTSGLRGEVIVADNGSVDDSVTIALTEGAKVVHASPKGYGIALSTGIAFASADVVVMGDADQSYDFGDIPRFVEKLQENFDVVVGNRFLGGVAPGAMPWSHRWIGNPILTAIGRVFFRCPIGDFHCGLRAIRKEAFERLQLTCPGMEFASEMIVRAGLAGLRLAEVPTTLQPDGRSRPPHLRSISDGWRHLKLLLFLCPRWLFFIPGFVLMLSGVLLQLVLAISGGLNLAGVRLGINTSLASGAFIFLGYQLIGSGVVVREVGGSSGKLPIASSEFRFKRLRIECGLLISVFLVAAGVGLFMSVLYRWQLAEFGDLPGELTVRRIAPAVTLIVLGAQTAWMSLMIGSMEMFSVKQLRSNQALRREGYHGEIGPVGSSANSSRRD